MTVQRIKCVETGEIYDSMAAICKEHGMPGYYATSLQHKITAGKDFMGMHYVMIDKELEDTPLYTVSLKTSDIPDLRKQFVPGDVHVIRERVWSSEITETLKITDVELTVQKVYPNGVHFTAKRKDLKKPPIFNRFYKYIELYKMGLCEPDRIRSYARLGRPQFN